MRESKIRRARDVEEGVAGEAVGLGKNDWILVRRAVGVR